MLMQSARPLGELENTTEFIARHIGIEEADEQHMLSVIGESSRRALIDSIVPRVHRAQHAHEAAAAGHRGGGTGGTAARSPAATRCSRASSARATTARTRPGVILRNVLENPAWYTAYTPYQAEISQGRMEALVNFQTMVCDLTGMPIANASMLDEATAAAEAMTLAKRSVKSKSNTFIVAGDCHPQTIEVVQTRAAPLGIEVVLANSADEWDAARLPATTSPCWRSTRPPAAASTTCAPTWKRCTRKQAAFIVAADLLALTLLVPPGEFGADIVVGTTQRFGMPMGAGGPHAAYLACRDEFKRSLPGRLVGVSVDSHGNPAYRLALQTREQHIRREKATSNICTAQVLPAVVASMYAVYHGPQGLRRIAQRVASYTAILAKGLEQLGYPPRAARGLRHRSACTPATSHRGDRGRARVRKHANLRGLLRGVPLHLAGRDHDARRHRAAVVVVRQARPGPAGLRRASRKASSR